MLILNRDYEKIEGLYTTEKSWGELREDFFKEFPQKLFKSSLGDLSSGGFGKPKKGSLGNPERILARNLPLGPVEGSETLTVIASSSVDWEKEYSMPLGLGYYFRDFVTKTCSKLDFELLP